MMRECKVDKIDSEKEAEAAKKTLEKSGCKNVTVEKEGNSYTVVGECED